MEQVQWPSAILVAALDHDLNSFFDAAVGLDAGFAQVVEATQDIVVPMRRVSEAEPALIDDLAGSK